MSPQCDKKKKLLTLWGQLFIPHKGKLCFIKICEYIKKKILVDFCTPKQTPRETVCVGSEEDRGRYESLSGF